MSPYDMRIEHQRSTNEKAASKKGSKPLERCPEDQQLTEKIEHAMRTSGYWALNLVRVSVRTQVVFLRGRVCSYYMKQIAQETALTVPGTRQIRNDLDVVQAS